jgi:hypothetical protein
MLMMRIFLAAIVVCALTFSAAAQTQPTPPEKAPPNDSKGAVIPPPQNSDPKMPVIPPPQDDSKMPVIPPPGSPGGNDKVQPK